MSFSSNCQNSAEQTRPNKPARSIGTAISETASSDLAIPELHALVALEPKNSDAQGNLGILLFFRGDYAGPPRICALL
jgi:hypothetical protein